MIPFQLTQRRDTKPYYLVITTRDPGVTGRLVITVRNSPSTDVIISSSSAMTSTSELSSASEQANKPDNKNGNDGAHIGGIIAGSVVGGVLFIILICGLCMVVLGTTCYCCRGNPFRSNKTYVRTGLRMQDEIGYTIFRPGSFSGYALKDGVWRGSEHFVLVFYPQAGQTVFGKGTDDSGMFTVTGTFSPRTLRMAFDKQYQAGSADAARKPGARSTIQVQYNPRTQNFEGKSYSKIGQERHEANYVVQMKSASLFRV